MKKSRPVEECGGGKNVMAAVDAVRVESSSIQLCQRSRVGFAEEAFFVRIR